MEDSSTQSIRRYLKRPDWGWIKFLNYIKCQNADSLDKEISMVKRPTSITIAAWYLIVTALLSLASIGSLNNPVAQELMSKNLLPMSAQYFMLFASFALTLVAGVGILLRHHWARVLFVAWSAVSIAIGLVTSPVKILAIPSVLIVALIAYFLFRAQAAAYFSAKAVATDA